MFTDNKADHVVILVTASTFTEAEKIADALLKNKEAACINIVRDINSFFRWQNKLQKQTEALLIIKSRKSLLKRIIATVKGHHSYSVPEIIALPIVAADKAYLDWIDEVT